MTREKELIEDIRQKLIGENLDMNKATKEALLVNNQMLNRALKQLAEHINAKEFHFIMELLQNAEDNDYSTKSPVIKFILKDDRLIVQNNEVGFYEQNIRAICDVGASTKKKSEGYIGEKGIGFKSVFKISDNPQIYSNGYSFCFRKSGNGQKVQLGYVLPEWIQETPEDIDPKLTNIVLPFKRKKYQSFKKQLDGISPNLLMFLNKIKRIHIEIEEDGSERIFSKKSTKAGYVEIKEEKRNLWYDTKEVISANHFYMVKHNIKVPKKYAIDVRKDIKNTDVIFGFPVNKKSNGYIIPYEDENLYDVYSFLPIDDFDFRYIIQADFILTTNRENIDEENPWNLWMKEEITKALKKTFLDFRETKFWSGFLYYLTQNADRKKYFTSVQSSLERWIRNQAIIPVLSQDNLDWKKPDGLIEYKKEVDTLYGQEIIEKNAKSKFVHPHFRLRDDIIELFSLGTWNWEREKACLNDTKWFLGLTKEKRYSVLESISLRYEGNGNVIEDLRDIKIFFIRNKKRPESFNQSTDGVFWPIDIKSDFKFGEDIRFLDENLQSTKSKQLRRIRGLYQRIGVKKPNIRTILKEHVIPIYEYEEDGEASKKLIRHHLDYFLFCLVHIDEIKKLKLFFDLKNSIFFLTEDKKNYSRPNDIYLGRPYVKDKLESFLDENEVSFLSKKYYEKAKRIGIPHKKLIQILIDLGFNQYARSNDLIKIFKTIDTGRIEKSLIYLNRYWLEYKSDSNSESLISSIKIPVNNELLAPTELFIKTKRISEILGNNVHYLPKYIESRQFIIDIGVNIYKIPNGVIINQLVALRNDKKQIDKPRITRLYNEFTTNEEVKEGFETENLIYCFNTKKWKYPWQCVWIVDNDDFLDSFSELSLQYTKKLILFFNEVGVNLNVEAENIIHFLSNIDSIETPTSILINKIEVSIALLSNLISKRRINVDSVLQLFDNDILPDQNRTFHNKWDIYISDNLDLYRLFSDKEVPIFKFSDRNTGYTREFIEVVNDLELQLLSEHVECNFIPPKKLRKNTEITEVVISLIRMIAYVLSHKSKNDYNELLNKFSNAENLKVYFVPNLEVEYSIDSIVEYDNSKFIIAENKIYFSQKHSVDNPLIGEALISYFEYQDLIADIIKSLIVLEIPFDQYLSAHNIPLPNEELDSYTKRRKRKFQDIFELDEEDHIEDQEEREVEDVTKQTELSQRKEFKRYKREEITQAEKWEPEVSPDFPVNIEEEENSESSWNENSTERKKQIVDQNMSGSISISSYSFSRNSDNSDEIGEWGEDFVFNNLACELKEEYSNRIFEIVEEDKLLIIVNSGKEIVRLENRNRNNTVQSGYDIYMQKDGVESLIEVKSTTWATMTEFELKSEQWDCCIQEQEKFVIMAVRDVGKATARIKKYSDVFSMYQNGQIRIVPSRLKIFL